MQGPAGNPAAFQPRPDWPEILPRVSQLPGPAPARPCLARPADAGPGQRTQTPSQRRRAITRNSAPARTAPATGRRGRCGNPAAHRHHQTQDLAARPGSAGRRLSAASDSPDAPAIRSAAAAARLQPVDVPVRCSQEMPPHPGSNPPHVRLLSQVKGASQPFPARNSPPQPVDSG